jgi:hypothetical protein
MIKRAAQKPVVQMVFPEDLNAIACLESVSQSSLSLHSTGLIRSFTGWKLGRFGAADKTGWRAKFVERVGRRVRI